MPADASPLSGLVKRVVQTGMPFSAAELQAMSTDGLLTPVYGNTYLRAGEPVTGGLRAQALSRSLPYSLRQRMTVGRLSAAWIYGCAPAPVRVSLLTDHQRRTTAPRPMSGIVVHEVDLPDGDVARVAGVAVTTPLRTACDLALYGSRERAAPALAALGSDAALHCTLEDVHTELTRLGRFPRKLAALTLLEEIMTSGGYVRLT